MSVITDVDVVLRVVKPSVELVSLPRDVRELLRLVETAGRTCYKSELKAGSGLETSRFVRGIVKSGHESVIEHGNVTMRVICSRSCSHQLVRHRIAAYSQESQRYCDYSKTPDEVAALQVICPPSVADLQEGGYRRERDVWLWKPVTVTKEERHRWYPITDATHDVVRANLWLQTVMECYHAYRRLRKLEVKAEDARSVLPNATKTEVVVTYNLRQWRHVCRERALNPRAQWEIRTLMLEALNILYGLLPDVFSDLVDVDLAKETKQ